MDIIADDKYLLLFPKHKTLQNIKLIPMANNQPSLAHRPDSTRSAAPIARQHIPPIRNTYDVCRELELIGTP